MEPVVKVLDHGSVELIDFMGNDLSVVDAARVSYGKRSSFMDRTIWQLSQDSHITELDDIMAIVDDDAKDVRLQDWDKKSEYYKFYQKHNSETQNYLKYSDWRLINHLAHHKHWSPFRHVQLKFHVKAPEFIARQWYKHVVGIAYTENGAHTVDHAWNEISMRYTDMRQANFYIPETVRKQSKDNKQASTDEPVTSIKVSGDYWGAVDITPQEAFRDHNERCVRLYEDLREGGASKEQARGVLPLSIYTEFYWTISLQGIINFIELRNKPGAQYEIQEYTKVLHQLVMQVAPVAVAALLGELKQ